MLMFATGAMNAVSLVVLAAPASSFFVWANPATAVCGLGGGLLLWLAVPHSAPRLDFDLAAAGGEGDGVRDARGEYSSGSFLGDSEVGVGGGGGAERGDGDEGGLLN